MTREAGNWLVALGWMNLLFVVVHHYTCHAWIPTSQSTSPMKRLHSFGGMGALDPSSRMLASSLSSSSLSLLSSSQRSLTTRLYAALPEGYREFGEAVIRQAGNQCGLTNPEDLSIEWKAGRIVVTVHVQSYVSATDEEGAGIDTDDIDYNDDDVDDDDEKEDDDDENAADEEFDEDIATSAIEGDDETLLDVLDDGNDSSSLGDQVEMQPNDDQSSSVTSPQGIIDVSVLARAINAALDDGGLGLAIAEVHEIEVTTPGASDEIQGPIMFNAYKGFDVICQQEDPKTKKVKQVEGRLVERNNEFTIINVKGRVKKMKNSTVLSVKLPKAKKEKGK